MANRKQPKGPTERSRESSKAVFLFPDDGLHVWAATKSIDFWLKMFPPSAKPPSDDSGKTPTKR